MIQEKTYVKTDKNGTKYYDIVEDCDKCNGHGAISHYRYIHNGICFKCDGAKIQKRTEKEYTDEYAKKLEENRQKRLAKKLEQERENREKKASLEHWKTDLRPNYLNNLIERKNREENKKYSQYVGEMKERLTLNLTLVFNTEFETQYGTSQLYKFIDKDKNVFIWFTTSLLFIDDEANDRSSHIEVGQSVTLKATIKGHKEYENEKQTLLTRCKQV